MRPDLLESPFEDFPVERAVLALTSSRPVHQARVDKDLPVMAEKRHADAGSGGQFGAAKLVFARKQLNEPKSRRIS